MGIKLTNEEFIRRVKENREITPLEEYVNRNTKISFMCKKGHTWKVRPSDILSGRGCPYCANKRVLIGYNDLATTSQDICQHLVHVDDAYKYTRWSNKRIDFKCTLCGHVQNRRVSTIAHRGFRCEHCGHGISYPNKFGRLFFNQLPIKEYKTEYHPKWASPYIYDFYFEHNGKQYIVEFDGLQHFRDGGSFNTPLHVRQEIDNTKNKLAADHGVDLIRIDCKKSEREYIRNSIECSKLNELFDLSIVDWMLCDEGAQKNLVKLTCDLWMSGIQSFDELSRKLHLGNSTVRDYIRKGVSLGWCDYDSRWWVATRRKQVCVTNIITDQKYVFDSIKSCSIGTIDICGHKVAEDTITKYCKNGRVYLDCLFQYVDVNNTKLIE